jgi:hypothetical protein
VVVIAVMTRWNENLASAVGSVTASEREVVIVGTGQISASTVSSMLGASLAVQAVNERQSNVASLGVVMVALPAATVVPA